MTIKRCLRCGKRLCRQCGGHELEEDEDFICEFDSAGAYCNNVLIDRERDPACDGPEPRTYEGIEVQLDMVDEWLQMTSHCNDRRLGRDDRMFVLTLRDCASALLRRIDELEALQKPDAEPTTKIRVMP